MWTGLIGCLLLIGCGFQPLSRLPDDAAVDVGTGPTGCFRKWMDHNVGLGESPARLLPDGWDGIERNPWISADGLRLYYTRDTMMANEGEIFQASWIGGAREFGAAQAVLNVNSSTPERRASLTQDESILVLTRDRGQEEAAILMATFLDGRFGSPDESHLDMVNGLPYTHRENPFLTTHGLGLYFSANSGNNGTTQLWFASRGSTGDDFGMPSLVRGIDPDWNVTDPVLSPDELVIVFSLYETAGGVRLYYATRPSIENDFGSPIQLPGANDQWNDADPAFSADGCELYFASTREGGHYHVFRTPVTE